MPKLLKSSELLPLSCRKPVKQIIARLRKNGETEAYVFFIKMIENMENNKSSSDFEKWLKKGGTSFLRDQICSKYKKYAPDENDLFNHFCALDSAWLNTPRFLVAGIRGI